MSVVSALLPSITPPDTRTGSGSGTPDDGFAAFANVLKSVLEKTQANAPPANANPPGVAISGENGKPPASAPSNAGAGDVPGKGARNAGEDGKPKATGDAIATPSGGGDPGGMTLAALVQAAATQAAPLSSPSFQAIPDAASSAPQGTPASVSAPSALLAALPQGAPHAGGAPSQDIAPGPADPAAPARLADEFAPSSAAGSTASAGDAAAGSMMAALQAMVSAAPVADGIAPALVTGSTASTGGAGAGSMMAALQAMVSAAPVSAGSVAPPGPRLVAPIRQDKDVTPETLAMSDAGVAATSNAPKVHALPAGTPTAPSKATTAQRPTPGAATSTTPWTGAADAGAAAAQVAGALAALAQGSASAPTDAGASPAGIGQGTAATGSTGADVPTSSTASSSSGLREMTIQLDPEHLGSVAITMRMAGGKLQIDIRVAKAQTLDVLNQDRHLLSAAVEAAGASRDNFSLGAASDQSPAPDQDKGLAGSGAQDGGGQQQTFSSRGSADGGGAGQGPAAGTAAFDTTRDDDNEPVSHAAARSLDGSLYV